MGCKEILYFTGKGKSKIDEENMPLRFTQRHLCWLKKGQTVERSAREEKKRKRKYGNFHSSLIPQPFGLFFLFCCVNVLAGTIRRQGGVTRYRRLVSGDDRTAGMLSGKPLLFLCWDSEYPV